MQTLRTNFQRTIIILISLIPGVTSSFGQAIKENNLGEALLLEKVIYIGSFPSRAEAKDIKMKVRQGKLYLLNDGNSKQKGLNLVRINLQDSTRDTVYIKTKYSIVEVADFDVKDERVYIFYGNNQLQTFDFKNNISRTELIVFPNELIYKSFYNIDTGTFIFYEWQIGQNQYEYKNTYKYYQADNRWETLDSNKIDGLNFLAITKGNKYMDVNEYLIAKLKPNQYEICIQNIKTNNFDTIRRVFDSVSLISADFMNDIHSKYMDKPRFYLFDSMDQHCDERLQIRSLRVSGDSLIYVNYQSKCGECEFMSNISFTRYLDVWKYDKMARIWRLHQAGMRLDNRAGCKKFNLKDAKKENIYFSLLGEEVSWCADSNRMLIPKLLSSQVDLNGDLSLFWKKEGRMGTQNLYVFVFQNR